jgi:hypothetical protein
MYARLLALCCLLSVAASAGGFKTTTPGVVELYLKAQGGTSPIVLKEMKLSLAELLRGAGLAVGWWSAQDQLSGVDGDLITIDLQGRCDPWAAVSGAAPANATILASTAISDGHVLPFSQLHCAAVNEFLGDSLESMPGPERERAYSRALARLLAHEVYHVMTQSTQHMTFGVAKAQVTPRDLLRDHFDFGGFLFLKARPLEPAGPNLQMLDSTR